MAHRKAIEGALPYLHHRIATIQRSLTIIKRELDSVSGNRLTELQEALARHLVTMTTRGPPGVGPVLWKRVVSHSFDGTLESLRNAWRVPGIGSRRAASINAWVSEMESRVPALLKGPFPGKGEIEERYGEQLNGRRRQFAEASQEVRTLTQVRVKARTELKRLRAVRPSTFRKAYKGDDDAASRVREFLLGTYAPWEVMPSWYRILIGPPGDASFEK